MKTNTLILIAALGLAPLAQAAGGNAQQSFERLKALAGEWEAQTAMGTAHLSYQVVAGGSALLERETAAKMPEMITVYHLDGGRLLLTHYCMAGNQPRMEARDFNAETGELEFGFVDATNLASPAAAHMHNVKLRLTDANHFSSEWTLFENGRPKTVEAFAYTRVQ